MKIEMEDIICLIGSTRFENKFRELEYELTKQGAIVLSPLVYNQSDSDPNKIDGKEKEIIDRITLSKIGMSDTVVVVDTADGTDEVYIGKSTSDQIRYAQHMGKRIKYLSKEVSY